MNISLKVFHDRLQKWMIILFQTINCEQSEKVLLPCSIRSLAPNRVKTLSTGVKLHDSAGT